MSKISVFRFNVNSSNSEYAKNMIGSYLSTRGFKYNDDTNTFETVEIKEKDKANTAINEGLSASTNLAMNNTVKTINPGIRGLQYSFEGNILIIKAYVIGKRKAKVPIHLPYDTTPLGTEYMIDLKNNLFKSFEARFISKISTSEEEIKDGKGKSIVGSIIFIIIGLAILAALAIFVFKII